MVATYGDEGAASDCATALRRGGLDAFMLGAQEIERDGSRHYVRDFEFRDDKLWVQGRLGPGIEIEFGSVELLLRVTGRLGPRLRAQSGRAHPILLVYPRAGATLAFRADEVWYQALGDALRPGRMANFEQLVAELRARCPSAMYDERLTDRANQAKILGPLRPDGGLDVATSIVARVYRTGAPYRCDRSV